MSSATVAIDQGPSGAEEHESMRNMDLSGQDLSGKDWSQRDFRGANLRGANLAGAVLFQADLSGAECFGADFSGANLTECVAEGTGFGHADLSGAELFSARMSGATFPNAQLVGADFRAATLLRARFRGADLQGVQFRGADLREADLTDTQVTGTSFEQSDLRGARIQKLRGFESANWIAADIQDVDFHCAYTVRRFVMDENYLYEFRNRDRTSLWLYRLWWLTSDCGRSFSRWGLLSMLVACSFGFAYSFMHLDFGDHPTSLSPYYFSVVTLTTLGYGDVLPISMASQIVVMVQVLLGYVMLGGLLSIFASKMGRRA